MSKVNSPGVEAPEPLRHVLANAAQAHDAHGLIGNLKHFPAHHASCHRRSFTAVCQRDMVCLEALIINAMVCSATEMAFDPPLLAMGIPISLMPWTSNRS